MTYGELAIGLSLSLLVGGIVAAWTTMNGFAAVPFWMAAVIPVQAAYGLFREHTDRSVFERWRDSGGDLGDRVDEAIRDEAGPPQGLPEPDLFLPDCDPWPPPDRPHYP